MFTNFRFYIANIFSLILLPLLFTNCSDDDGASAPETSAYYFSADLNGSEYDFLHVAKYQGGGNDGRLEHIVIAGYETAYPENYDPIDLEQVPHQFGFEFWNLGGDIVAGTYTSAATDDQLSASYLIQTNEGTIIYGTSDTEDFTLNIEEVNENGIKGTFYGTLMYGAESEVISVTNGMFYLPYDELINP